MPLPKYGKGCKEYSKSDVWRDFVDESPDAVVPDVFAASCEGCARDAANPTNAARAANHRISVGPDLCAEHVTRTFPLLPEIIATLPKPAQAKVSGLRLRYVFRI